MPPETVAQTPATTADKPLLLIVDDSRLMRHALKKILSDGYTLIEAEDGEDAWDKLRKNPGVQAVFSDLSMPGMDGFGLLKCIREADNAAIQSLPVIVITGNEDDAVVKEKALGAGASSFITKPFQSAQIKSCAEQYTRSAMAPETVAGISEDMVRQAAEEAARIEAEAQARAQAAHERRIQAEAETRRRAEESRRQAEAEAARLRAEEEARIHAEEERVRIETEARRRTEEEARREAQAETERLAREAESARIRATLKAIQAHNEAERVEHYSPLVAIGVRLVLPLYAIVNRLCGRRFDRHIKALKERL